MRANGPRDSAPPLSVRSLTVDYGTLRAVDGLSFVVRPGEIYGLLGSNGAGKSSTIKSVVGLLSSKPGTVSVFGADPAVDPMRSKALIGYVPEVPLLYDALTPREFLEFVTSVRKISPDEATRRAANYLAAFQIETEFDRPIATLSNGTRQKVLLMAGLLHQPPLLVLDEPLNNLDPRSVRIMKELLASYPSDGQRGVLFSTHSMEVAEQLCHRVGILDRGVLRGEGTLPELRRAVGDGTETLEEIFLRLTHEREGVRQAVRNLGVG